MSYSNTLIRTTPHPLIQSSYLIIITGCSKILVHLQFVENLIIINRVIFPQHTPLPVHRFWAYFFLRERQYDAKEYK